MVFSLKKIGQKLADPTLLFYTLPWLICLLVAGTIAQKYMGLYQAQHMFFSSWILWYGFLPLPGGRLTLALIFVTLAAKFLFKSKWSWSQSGIILTHFGVLLLFIGGFITAYNAKESFILIPEGQRTNILQDYYQKGLYIKKDGAVLHYIPDHDLTLNSSIIIPDSPIRITPRAYCKNCTFKARETDSNIPLYGLAQQIALSPIPDSIDEEANMGGVTLHITHAGDDIDGLYTTTEAAPHPIEIDYKNAHYEIIFSRKETLLPFSIQLDKFEKIFHPGTEMAQHYSSTIQIIDDDTLWPAYIKMNEPLRYKGYTFFQSSYADTPLGPATILAVVENKGRLFPYIASLIIAVGLILHLLILSIRRRG